MKKITRRSFLEASGLLAASAALTACTGSTAPAGNAAASGAAGAAGSGTAHEPITIMDANRDYTGLMELVHRTYPEIELQVEAYKGRNTTAYMKKQLEVDSFPDIYSTTQAWDDQLLAEHLIDLSQYPVTDLYNQVHLNAMDVDGATYLLPFDFTINGIYCNRSLFERLGIEIPSSFAQLRDETVPQLKAAGAEVAVCLMDPVGYFFQYFFNVADTSFMNTRKGREWQKKFIAGSVQAGDELLSCADEFQQWIDCGMINLSLQTEKSGAVFDHFAEGNTAFLLGSFARFSQNDDGTGDQYILMPYLSMDGSQNVYVTQNARCYGLNKRLAEPGSEQKLQDALHVLEILSSNEGYQAVIGEITSSMCAVQEFSVPENSPFYTALTEINTGHSAPLIYNGWEDYLIPFGTAIHDWIAGDRTKEEAIQALNDKQADLLANGRTYYADVTEELDTEQAAILCGQMFLAADPGADAALISCNVYYPDLPSTQEDAYGANGRILPGKMSEEDITIFLPTGWYDHLQTSVLTGAEIKKMGAEGCDLRDNGHPFPYVLMTRDGMELDDAAEYTVILCGYPKSRKDELDLQDTGIVGLDAAKEYLLSVSEVSSAMLKTDWVKN